MQPVKLRHGDMFDGASDLIVLPCSIYGTVTDFVGDALRNYNIQPPKDSYSLGDVDIRPFVGGEHIAPYVAFAASVAFSSSNLNAIRAIGENLGRFTVENSVIRSISAPLLGAGAGGLRSEDVVVNLRDGFRSTAHADAMLTISILHKQVFERVSRNIQDLSPINRQHQEQRIIPRVFISYTDTAPEHKQWIIDLATFLRANGIDARIDDWHLRLGMDLAQWMTNELQLADRVIIISDARYTQKANARLGGVGWETMIIQGDMMGQPPNSNKHIVLVREREIEQGIPTYLRTKYCLHWHTQSDEHALRNKLIRELFSVSAQPPAIGEPPVWL